MALLNFNARRGSSFRQKTVTLYCNASAAFCKASWRSTSQIGFFRFKVPCLDDASFVQRIERPVMAHFARDTIRAQRQRIADFASACAEQQPST